MLKKIPYFSRASFLYAFLFVWMAVIFYFSSIAGSGAVSEMPTVLLFERKGAHIVEYSILTFLFLRIFSTYLPKNKVRTAWISAFCALIYAVSDEVHQLFVFGRTGKVTDVLIDSIGIGLMIGLFLYAKHRSYRSIDDTVHTRYNKGKRKSRKKEIKIK
jgi:VanZ family protein